MLCCAAWMGVAASAQVTSGSVSGYILDPSSKNIPGAHVTIRDASHSMERKTEADASGFYRFERLAPGPYTITASADRFAPRTIEGIAVTVATQTRVDLTLALAGMEQSVAVTARIPRVAAGTSDLGTVVDRSRVDALPLNRRDFLQLALLTPGVLTPVEDSELSSRGSVAMHANGGREEFNNFLLDGVDNNDPNINKYNLQPPVDAIQEFKLSTNSYSAEYGRSGAGQVNVVTRSGSNTLHGFAYEYLRNRVLDSANYFAAGTEKNKYIRNQFGGGVGGAIVRDRTFFFANADGLRERVGVTRISSVPVDAIRQGDLSSLGVTIVDPFTRQPFAGNRIPASRIHPLSAKVFDMFPKANLAGGTANLFSQPVGRDEQNQFNARVDHYASAKDILTFRYSLGRKSIFEPFVKENADVPGYGNDVRDLGHNAMAQYQRVFSARAINTLLLGFNRLERSVLPENAGRNVNQLWGVNWLPGKPLDFGFPSVTVAGFSKAGDPTQLPLDRAANTYQLNDNFSLLRGAHSIKMGFEMRRQQHNGIQDLLARGSMTFSGALSGAGASDLLLGLLSFGIQSQADAVQTLRTTATNYYLQDDWKVAPSLTLNLGVRYEYNTPPTDPTNRMTVLNLATGTLAGVGTNGLSRSGTRPDRNNVAPRVGFAWSPQSNTVIRGGYGLFYDSGMMVANTSLYFNPPQFTIRAFFPTATSLITLSNPFPTNGGITPAASLSSLSPDLVQAYLQHWNFNVQREFRSVGVFSIAYAGSKGTHLIRSRDLNQPQPGSTDLTRRRPLPAFSNIFLIESGGNSNYNSLQASWNRAMARGFSLFATYTYGKSIDDTSAFLGTKADKNFPQNSQNYAAERAVSSFDARHRMTFAGVWKLPLGFQSSAILNGYTGQPFTPILRFDNSNTGNTGGTYGNDRPNVSGDPNNGPRTPARWFNTAAFAIPARYTFGNAGRNIVRGPGFFTADASLMRKFQLTEKLALQFEGQAFNLFNRTNLNLPERYVDEPATFGRILSARAPRQFQLTGRFTF